jgi:hypothetical protein
MPKTSTTRVLTDGQRAYEERRAAKAGMSLEKWLSLKDKEAEAAAREAEKAAKKATPPKPPGFLKRLIDKAHKPI